MKKIAILAVLTVALLAATVYLNFAMRSAELDYTEVDAVVLTSETVTTKVKGNRMQTYKITAEYNGVTYDLENAHSSSAYRPGATTTAYFANGHLYANIEGVRTSGPMGTAYFVCLFGTVAMVGITATLWSKERRAQKEKAKVS